MFGTREFEAENNKSHCIFRNSCLSIDVRVTISCNRSLVVASIGYVCISGRHDFISVFPKLLSKVYLRILTEFITVTNIMHLDILFIEYLYTY